MKRMAELRRMVELCEGGAHVPPGVRGLQLFPGGFGTMDEMFEALTLIQTGRMKRVPFLLFGQEFWEKIINWEALADAGTISPDDLELFRYVETAEEAFEALHNWDGAGQKRDVIPGR